MEIKKFIHRFDIAGNNIEVYIECSNDFWQATPVNKSFSGTGSMSGGKYDSLEEYITNVERQHRYSYNFFNKGYQYAKANI